VGAVDSLSQFARRASGIAIRWAGAITPQPVLGGLTTNIAESNFRYIKKRQKNFAPKLTG
jgi:hypothetical protein